MLWFSILLYSIAKETVTFFGQIVISILNIYTAISALTQLPVTFHTYNYITDHA